MKNNKNKNNLNVFTYGYLPMSYWKNWFYNIGQFFRNIKYAYQRITKGYCNQDLWNLDYYYSELFYQSLNKLAEITCAYPGVGEFSDENSGFEAWQKFLKELAEHFRNTQEDNLDAPINKEVDDLFNEMQEYLLSYDFEDDPKTGYSKLVEKYKDEDKYKEVRNKWYEKTIEAAKFREAEKDIAFDMMKKHFFNLWD